MSSNGRGWAPLILMAIVSFGFLGLCVVLAFHQVPPENKDSLEAMLGGLGTAFTLIVGFYFGTSHATPVPPSPHPPPPPGVPS